jgi:predicted enzyme related to lactoylglutathione lyase
LKKRRRARFEPSTFWQADQLGGRVLVEPHDVPGFRSTALADPQGAVFSASQLMVR